LKYIRKKSHGLRVNKKIEGERKSNLKRKVKLNTKLTRRMWRRTARPGKKKMQTT